MDLRELHRSEL